VTLTTSIRTKARHLAETEEHLTPHDETEGQRKRLKANKGKAMSRFKVELPR